MRKNFILDTNVLLYDPNVIFSFDDNNVIIPFEVIEELDTFKRDMTDLGHNARVCVKQLDRLRQEGRLGEGIKLSNGGLLRVHASDPNDYRHRGPRLSAAVDRAILSLAIELSEQDDEQPTIVVSKSINLRLRADALGIYAEDYEESMGLGGGEVDPGYRELSMPLADIEQIQADGGHVFESGNLHANEYILIRDEAGSKTSVLGRIADAQGRRFETLPGLPEEDIVGIRPQNLGQTFAMDALLRDDIKLVCLTGKAGTGKTLLAVAAGLYKVMREDRYRRLLVSRMTVPMGRDIGYIPGDIEEKMRPWMQPIYDAIEMICELDKRSGRRMLPPDIFETDEVGIEPLTYIRGRSIPHQFMIIDEAQNLTPLEVKTVITRVGRGTKIILTGDPEQIDNPYIDSLSNGLIYLVNRFRNHPIAAHIALLKGERSELAEAAANLL